jgi:hypothetical protein
MMIFIILYNLKFVNVCYFNAADILSWPWVHLQKELISDLKRFFVKEIRWVIE